MDAIASMMLIEIVVGALIVSVCLLHVAGLLVMAEWLLQRREHLERKRTAVLVLVLLFCGIMLLHLIEASIWASLYYFGGLFDDFEIALYFSLTSYTTIGYGDVLLPQRWRLLGAVEGIFGVLLCGISTAFIFVVLNALFRIRIRRQSEGRQDFRIQQDSEETL